MQRSFKRATGRRQQGYRAWHVGRWAFRLNQGRREARRLPASLRGTCVMGVTDRDTRATQPDTRHCKKLRVCCCRAGPGQAACLEAKSQEMLLGGASVVLNRLFFYGAGKALSCSALPD